MFAFTKSDLSRVVVSAVGALTVSATCILGAVGPAKAAAPTTVPAWRTQVEHRIVRATPDMANRFDPVPGAQATVAVHFTTDGDYAGATLVGSTGYRQFDRRAVSLARSLHYPRLPETVRGRPQDVTMRLAFGPALQGAEPVRMVSVAPAGQQIASR
jgi:TonB family protein